MLIYKIDNNNYRFFDPNTGITVPLNKESLFEMITQKQERWQIETERTTTVHFINNDKYLNEQAD